MMTIDNQQNQESQIENPKNNKDNKKSSFLKELLQWVSVIVLALLISFVLKSYVVEHVKVEGPSMQDTLFTGQRLVIYKLGYKFHAPKQGDIIVLEYQKGSDKFNPFGDPNEIDYIKRVIAVPGDSVDIRDDFVYVNGEKLNEPYALGLTDKRSMQLPVTVPPNKVFVLGDNRAVSRDSREIGYVDFDRIKGKAVFRIWPMKDFGGIYGNMK